jgi:lipoprotein-anchoring transpeptidase ErfK/SrfK
MDRRTGADWHGASRRRINGVLVAVFCGFATVAAPVTVTPLAQADPDDPPPPVPAPAVNVPPPVDPLAAPPPPVDPPPVDPPPADPLAAPPPPVPGVNVPPPINPLAPPASDPAAVAVTVAGQNPQPFTGDAPFRPPTFNPVNGAMVGVAKPIIINFAVPIADRPMAEQAIHISSIPPVPGKFYWMNDSQVRWRPLSFWPAGTVVNIDAAGTKSNFHVGDALVATADNATHQLTITRNGQVVKTFPMSMGEPGHDTPNGTYYVLEKFPDVVMDSATFGVPNTSPGGYKVHVQLAVRFDNSGNFVHSAPWSVADQGKRNVSHGCINISPANAQWFFDNFGSGDAIVVKNSVGSYTQNDGAQDWQI